MVEGITYKIIMSYDLNGNKTDKYKIQGKFIKMCFIDVNIYSNEYKDRLFCPLFEFETIVNYMHTKKRKIKHQRLIFPLNYFYPMLPVSIKNEIHKRLRDNLK